MNKSMPVFNFLKLIFSTAISRLLKQGLVTLDDLPPPTKNICFKILHFFTNNFFDHYNFLLISFQPCIDSVPMLTTLRKAGSMFPERC